MHKTAANLRQSATLPNCGTERADYRAEVTAVDPLTAAMAAERYDSPAVRAVAASLALESMARTVATLPTDPSELADLAEEAEGASNGTELRAIVASDPDLQTQLTARNGDWRKLGIWRLRKAIGDLRAELIGAVAPIADTLPEAIASALATLADARAELADTSAPPVPEVTTEEAIRYATQARDGRAVALIRGAVAAQNALRALYDARRAYADACEAREAWLARKVVNDPIVCRAWAMVRAAQNAADRHDLTIVAEALAIVRRKAIDAAEPSRKVADSLSNLRQAETAATCATCDYAATVHRQGIGRTYGAPKTLIALAVDGAVNPRWHDRDGAAKARATREARAEMRKANETMAVPWQRCADRQAAIVRIRRGSLGATVESEGKGAPFARIPGKAEITAREGLARYDVPGVCQ